MKLPFIVSTALLFAGGGVGPINTAYADLQGSALELCDRVKVCANDNLNIETSDTNNQAVLEILIDGLCAQIATPLVASVMESEHEEAAQVCMEDVLDLNCSALMAGDAKELESCKTLKELAEESGATFD